MIISSILSTCVVESDPEDDVFSDDDSSSLLEVSLDLLVEGELDGDDEEVCSVEDVRVRSLVGLTDSVKYESSFVSSVEEDVWWLEKDVLDELEDDGWCVLSAADKETDSSIYEELFPSCVELCLWEVDSLLYSEWDESDESLLFQKNKTIIKIK